jgi:hypothetical protein
MRVAPEAKGGKEDVVTTGGALFNTAGTPLTDPQPPFSAQLDWVVKVGVYPVSPVEFKAGDVPVHPKRAQLVVNLLAVLNTNPHLSSTVGFLSNGREYLFMEARRDHTFSVLMTEVLAGSEDPASGEVLAIAKGLVWWWGRVCADCATTLSGEKEWLKNEQARVAGSSGSTSSPSASSSSPSSSKPSTTAKENTSVGERANLTRQNLSIKAADPGEKLHLHHFLEALVVTQRK